MPSVQLQHDLARLRETLEMYSRKVRRAPRARARHSPRPEVDQVPPAPPRAQIEVERRHAEELDKQILACDIRAMDQRKVMGGAGTTPAKAVPPTCRRQHSTRPGRRSPCASPPPTSCP